ncbi:uncharacterized protein BXZ73DRAFT_98625 [Epithele typhae]|uniref:uncharacterized protein n=1 Tax=Epithele typhae TaxID=378194 RepID=UPI0020073318|nr:uncharacterized protein BXZ73DRAFT_98625 [Epithele typhae]KAH9940798.1 hypothetical protein BXZ73DRAFT_98625 [Epithele typhae]
MSLSSLLLTSTAFSLAGSAAAQINGGSNISNQSHKVRLAAGAIAGIAIGVIALIALLTLIGVCCLCRKRRRAGFSGTGGTRFGRFGRTGGPMGTTAATGPGMNNGNTGFNYAGAQESGPGMGGWNQTAQPAYQPPHGAPPTGLHAAPHPGGFTAPQQAHTKPY